MDSFTYLIFKKPLLSLFHIPFAFPLHRFFSDGDKIKKDIILFSRFYSLFKKIIITL